MITFVCILIGALLFRIRGGLQQIKLPTTTAGRLAWSIGMPLLAYGLRRDLGLMAMAPAFFLGAVVGMHGFIDMGRNEGTLRGDALTALWRGPVFVWPAAGVIWLLGYAWVPLGIAGLLCPACYALGHWLPAGPRGLSGGAEKGEALFGAVVGIALSVTMV